MDFHSKTLIDPLTVMGILTGNNMYLVPFYFDFKSVLI